MVGMDFERQMHDAHLIDTRGRFSLENRSASIANEETNKNGSS